MPHTPAPWAIVTPDLLRGVLDLDPSALVIANLNAENESASVVADVWTVGDNGSEQHANATLIAAAPDLLKVAHAAYHALKSYQYGNASPDLAAECAELLIDVIVKAEGR